MEASSNPHLTHASFRSNTPLDVPNAMITSQLPKGSCHFRQIDLGLQAPNCGCQRFCCVTDAHQIPSLSQTVGTGVSGAWCYCGHHACFHAYDHASSRATAAPSAVHSRPLRFDPSDDITNDALPTTVPDTPRGLARSTSPSQRTRSSNSHPRGSRPNAKSPRAHNLHPNSAQYEWNKLKIRSDPSPLPRHTGRDGAAEPTDGSGLGLLFSTHAGSAPAFAPQHPHQGTDSRLPSTQPMSVSPTEMSSHLRVARQSIYDNGTSVAHTEGQPQRPQIHTGFSALPQNAEDLAQSATEIATPSNAGTPAVREGVGAFALARTGMKGLHYDLLQVDRLMGLQSSPGKTSTSHHDAGNTSLPRSPSTRDHRSDLERNTEEPASPTIANLVSEIASLRKLLASPSRLGVSLLDINNRLDSLESASFSHGSLDELNERFEFFDGRILDVEGRIEELENSSSAYNRDGEVFPPRRHQNGLFQESFASSETPLLFNNGASGPRLMQKLGKLEERIESLQDSIGPTTSQPWEIEVVLLPWGSNLNGIWYSSDEVSQGSRVTTQESAPAGASTFEAIKSGSPGAGQNPSGWNTSAKGQRHPRACGPASGLSGRVFDRLNSRGFVRAIQIRQGDAGHIHSAVCSAFGDLLKSQVPSSAAQVPHLLGLQSAFVPLRKVHKSSRLQFVSVWELTTAAIWNANFLQSSVFMKAPRRGVRRLFITTPDAYLQDEAASGRTWQSIRELPRCSPAMEEEQGKASGGVGEADAKEECWLWDAKLDPSPSQQPSFASIGSFQPQSASFSSHPLSPQPTLPKRSSPEHLSQDSDPVFSSEEGCGEHELFDADQQGQRTPERHMAPITPLSEFPSSRAAQCRRTASCPLSESLSYASRSRNSPRGLNHVDRQVALASFDTATGPAFYSPPRKIGSLSKKRRISFSPDLSTSPDRNRRNGDQAASLRADWGLTPRRSREPASPRAASPEGQSAVAQDTSKRHLSRGVSSEAMYMTPYSYTMAQSTERHFAGPPQDENGDTDLDMSGDEGEERDSLDRREASTRGQGVDFDADELHLSREDEMEFDRAMTAEEERWDGSREAMDVSSDGDDGDGEEEEELDGRDDNMGGDGDDDDEEDEDDEAGDDGHDDDYAIAGDTDYDSDD